MKGLAGVYARDREPISGTRSHNENEALPIDGEVDRSGFLTKYGVQQDLDVCAHWGSVSPGRDVLPDAYRIDTEALVQLTRV